MNLVESGIGNGNHWAEISAFSANLIDFSDALLPTFCSFSNQFLPSSTFSKVHSNVPNPFQKCLEFRNESTGNETNMYVVGWVSVRIGNWLRFVIERAGNRRGKGDREREKGLLWKWIHFWIDHVMRHLVFTTFFVVSIGKTEKKNNFDSKIFFSFRS